MRITSRIMFGSITKKRENVTHNDGVDDGYNHNNSRSYAVWLCHGVTKFYQLIRLVRSNNDCMQNCHWSIYCFRLDVCINYANTVHIHTQGYNNRV